MGKAGEAMGKAGTAMGKAGKVSRERLDLAR